ncbi:TCP-1/cpn60 chaperonin family protein [Halegenticoccus tardaugens]|uniref:TCP-1/cpn60 chaperonin family protein n=1 Tax=Halegenticoccus tardaugens TaxID=2071624 RepID=UPI00100C1684|nr:TCP-1/cpn60 chaperonin family protein [Halegenticoccus tardaugens]
MADKTQNSFVEMTRLTGGEFREESFRAAQALGQVLRPTYGPCGRDKLLVDHLGTGYISKQGTDILDRVNVDNPVAQLIADSCKSSEYYADGSTFAVLLACALLEEAEALVEYGLAPVEIAHGFERARVTAEKALKDMAVPLELNKREQYALVSTATSGRLTDTQIKHLRQVALDAAAVLAPNVEIKQVYFEESIRLSLDRSRVVAGAILRANLPHHDMPKDIVDADILLLSAPVTKSNPKELIGEESVTFGSVEAIDGITESARQVFEGRVQAIVESGADVVVCRGNLDSSVIYELAAEGILVFHKSDVSAEDFARVHRAVGGTTVPPEDIESASLGHAGRVTVTNIGSGTINGVLFADCEDPDIVSIVVHAGTASGSDQAKRILKQGIGSIAAVYDDPRAVPGGGASELEAAHAIRDVATRVGERTTLATEAYADALESTVIQLIQNAGYDALDTLPRLKKAHADGTDDAALDIENGDITLAYEWGIIEPHESKRLSLQSGTEAAISILRIDALLPRTGGEVPDLGPDGNPMSPPGVGWGSGDLT